jgi:hypothetical protein
MAVITLYLTTQAKSSPKPSHGQHATGYAIHVDAMIAPTMAQHCIFSSSHD